MIAAAVGPIGLQRVLSDVPASAKSIMKVPGGDLRPCNTPERVARPEVGLAVRDWKLAGAGAPSATKTFEWEDPDVGSSHSR